MAKSIVKFTDAHIKQAEKELFTERHKKIAEKFKHKLRQKQTRIKTLNKEMEVIIDKIEKTEESINELKNKFKNGDLEDDEDGEYKYKNMFDVTTGIGESKFKNMFYGEWKNEHY